MDLTALNAKSINMCVFGHMRYPQLIASDLDLSYIRSPCLLAFASHYPSLVYLDVRVVKPIERMQLLQRPLPLWAPTAPLISQDKIVSDKLWEWSKGEVEVLPHTLKVLKIDLLGYEGTRGLAHPWPHLEELYVSEVVLPYNLDAKGFAEILTMQSEEGSLAPCLKKVVFSESYRHPASEWTGGVSPPAPPCHC